MAKSRFHGVALGISLVLSGCSTEEKVQVRSAGTQSLGFVHGQVLASPPPNAYVALREQNGKLMLLASWVGVCNRTERGVERRVQTTTTRVSTTSTVTAGIVAGSGMALYFWPDLDAQTSVMGGTVLVAIGGISYLIALARTGEKTEDLPPREVDRPAPAGPCTIAPLAGEPIVVEGTDATLEGTTNARGYVQFDGTVSAPVEVRVRGRTVQKAEWLR